MRSLASFLKLFGLASLLAFLTCNALAQSAQPTSGVLARVLMVQSQYFSGSIFSIDVDNREYWITAKHILTGAKHPPYGSIASKSVSLKILNPGAEGEQWMSVVFSVIDPGNDVDIVVLAPPGPLMDGPFQSIAVSSDNIGLGNDCEFLGFPFGGGWRAKFDNGKSYWMPFIKHCVTSAFNTEPQRMWVLDGINNDGFSGGPVIYHTGPQQQIFAVISGVRQEPAEVIFGNSEDNLGKLNPPASQKATVNVNSGFIIAYDIKYATDAIAANPIGPLRIPK
jgi:hypothetical protein